MSRRDDVVRWLAQGRELQSRGRWADAFACYQSAYKVAPEDAQVLALLGGAYVAMGQAALGIAFLRRSVTRDPRAASSRRGLAMALAAQGELEEAAREMAAACEFEPGEAALHIALADLLQQLGRHAEAERCFESAIALDAGHAAWHESLARLRYARWDEAGALDSAQRATALSPAVAERLNIGFAAPNGPRVRPPSAAPLIEPSRLLGAQELERACEERELMVWDDVLDDPHAYRAQALQRVTREATLLPQVNFPGLQTPPQDSAFLMQRVANALGRRIKWESPDHGALRVSLANDEARADVHVDNASLPHIFGGVLYLSLPEDCRGGTAFYRHRKSGWDGRPEPAALRAKGYASFLDFQKRHVPPNRRQPFVQWQQQREATWDRLFTVPMRFNRLIVFRSDFFHAVTELFGDAPQNGRLVQLFHFESEP